MTALDGRVQHGPVVVWVGGAALPAASVQPELPGSEYVHVFDLVHAAVLRWSPNVVRAMPAPVPGLAGADFDCPLEDAINALTYSLAVHRAGLTTDTSIDPVIVTAVTALAARGTDVPDSIEAWTTCLRQSIDLHEAVSRRDVRGLTVDLDGGRVAVSH